MNIKTRRVSSGQAHQVNETRAKVGRWWIAAYGRMDGPDRRATGADYRASSSVDRVFLFLLGH